MAISTADPRLSAALTCVDVFYQRLFRDWPSAVNRVGDGYVMSYSGDNRLTGANHLWVEEASALRVEVLERTARFFEAFGAAWSVITTDTHLPEAIDFLTGLHFHVRWRSPLMVLEGAPRPLPVRRDSPVIRASTPRHLLDVQQVMTEAFATRRSVNERVARLAHLHDPDVDHYLMYASESVIDEALPVAPCVGESPEMGACEPVACATVVHYGGMAGVWNVGTRRAWRRQGYATTIMHALLADQAARGRSTSMLMASAAGQPLYAALGYREIGLTYYSGPPFAGSPYGG